MTTNERRNEEYRQSQQGKGPMALPTYEGETKCSNCSWLGRLAGRTVCPNCGKADALRVWKW